MRLTRLYLRNYRVYEDPVDLEMPAGLVGIFGRNGAGKSTLLESILWTLWGRARTPKDQIRTSGVNGDCVSEVEFEHEGHLYLVRRTISGMGHTVRAQATSDGAQVAEGVRDVARYVHSVLGMDDLAFRASVFAEQKQLAAFSSQAPAERRKLVMQLLGITPLEGARDQARRDAKAAAEQLTRFRTLLPDRASLADQLAAAERAAAEAAAGAERAGLLAQEVRDRAERAAAAHELVADAGREHEALVREGRGLRQQRDELAVRTVRLSTELEGLDDAATRLALLEPMAAALPGQEQQLVIVLAVVAAARALAAVPEPAVVTEPDDATVESTRLAAEGARAEAAELDGRLAAARAALTRAEEMAAPARDLSGEADCPLCGQALGKAFDRVRAHRDEEVARARAEVVELDAARSKARAAADKAERVWRQAVDALQADTQAWAAFLSASDRRRVLVEAHTTARQGLGRDPEPGEAERLTAEVDAGRRATAECAGLRGRLERRSAAAAELAADRDRLASLDSELENLRDKVRSLGFRPEALEAAKAALAREEAASRQAGEEEQRLRAIAAAAVATADGCRLRLVDADEQHARLTDLEEDSRHLGRLSELLHVFRNTVVASVGPRLSLQAADLFSELTDGEYDRLEVDADTYEIQIRDAGIVYGMDRFSGSETDLANLALRVAISEHVRFQSGGAVGLLVLDEVFGPLDQERTERMLLALERLRARFRQVLVVTHSAEIKEQLPSAIEVVKLPGRRATARVVNGA